MFKVEIGQKYQWELYISLLKVSFSYFFRFKPTEEPAHLYHIYRNSKRDMVRKYLKEGIFIPKYFFQMKRKWKEVKKKKKCIKKKCNFYNCSFQRIQKMLSFSQILGLRTYKFRPRNFSFRELLIQGPTAPPPPSPAPPTSCRCQVLNENLMTIF